MAGYGVKNYKRMVCRTPWPITSLSYAIPLQAIDITIGALEHIQSTRADREWHNPPRPTRLDFFFLRLRRSDLRSAENLHKRFSFDSSLSPRRLVQYVQGCKKIWKAKNNQIPRNNLPYNVSAWAMDVTVWDSNYSERTQITTSWRRGNMSLIVQILTFYKLFPMRYVQNWSREISSMVF